MMTKHSVTNQLLPLSEEEINELDSFLMSEATSYETMSIDALDGYLTAIVIGPTTLFQTVVFRYLGAYQRGCTQF